MVPTTPSPYAAPRPARPAHASESIAPYAPETGARAVKLFRNGANQAVRIPREFELPGEEAVIEQLGDTLVIRPLAAPLIKGSASSLAAVLATMEPIDEEFPDVDAGLLPLDDIEL